MSRKTSILTALRLCREDPRVNHCALSGVAQVGRSAKLDSPAPTLISQRPSVELLNRNALQVDSFEAANVDRGNRIALWIDAFPVRVNAASSAKAVLDHVLVERVCADVLFRAEQAQLLARHKPEKRSLAGTHGAIACHRPRELAFCLERNFTAVTATLIFHLISL